MTSITILPTFQDNHRLRAAMAIDPPSTRIYTHDDHRVLFVENKSERFVAADRWHMEVEELAAFINENGPGLSYTDPASFAYSVYRKRFAPRGFVTKYGLPDDGFRFGFACDAFYGGRQEVFRYGDYNLHQYTINGSNLFSALQLSFPITLGLKYARPPTLDNIMCREGVSEVIFSQSGDWPILPVRVGHRAVRPVDDQLRGTTRSGIAYEAPADDCVLHPVGRRVLYPAADHARGIYTHTELRYAIERGVIIHTVGKQYAAEATMDPNPFREFIEYCWERRTEQAGIWKQIAYALFSSMSTNQGGLICFRLADYTPASLRLAAIPGDFGYICVGQRRRARPNVNPLWAAMVLADARCRLHSLIGPSCHFVDTDCAFFDDPQPLPVDPAVLGSFTYRYGRYSLRGPQALIRESDGPAQRTEAEFFADRETQAGQPLPGVLTAPYALSAKQTEARQDERYMRRT